MKDILTFHETDWHDFLNYHERILSSTEMFLSRRWFVVMLISSFWCMAHGTFWQPGSVFSCNLLTFLLSFSGSVRFYRVKHLFWTPMGPPGSGVLWEMWANRFPYLSCFQWMNGLRCWGDLRGARKKQHLQNQQNQITHEGFRGNESPIPLPSCFFFFFRVIFKDRPMKNHHCLPPFGRRFLGTCSKHRTSKSKPLLPCLLGSSQDL